MRRIVSILLLFALVWIGIQYYMREEIPAADDSSNLYAARCEYLGNNTEVLALVNAVGAASLGRYTIALETDERPYRLIVNYDELKRPFAKTNFEQPAILLLGLIDNCDEVYFQYGEERYMLTKQGATTLLGKDVKTLARSETALQSYLNRKHRE